MPCLSGANEPIIVGQAPFPTTVEAPIDEIGDLVAVSLVAERDVSLGNHLGFCSPSEQKNSDHDHDVSHFKDPPAIPES